MFGENRQACNHVERELGGSVGGHAGDHPSGISIHPQRSWSCIDAREGLVEMVNAWLRETERFDKKM